MGVTTETRPVILLVDDEAEALDALAEAMRRRFDRDYRIVAEVSAHAALQELTRLHAVGEPVALVVADQWMPELPGVELLSRVHDIDPDAMRALLVAWGDRDAGPTVLEGCAFGQLDNYILKPWIPAEVHLYPLVERVPHRVDTRPRPTHGAGPLIGDDPSPRAHELRRPAAAQRHPSRLLRRRLARGASPAGGDGLHGRAAAAGLAARRPRAGRSVERRAVRRAGRREAFGPTGVKGRVPVCDLAIVGAGPAGLAAAVYAASEGLRTLRRSSAR